MSSECGRPNSAATTTARENYTELLWFFEGFTSYYDDLLLRRCGLIDDASYLRLVGKTISGVLAAPGRKLQSVAQSSFDAWVKYYRPDENTPNATISYYTKGALVALAIDLSCAARKRGTLDDVMRSLWLRSAGGPIRQADIAQALQDVSGRSFEDELAAWVHGTDDLPLVCLARTFRRCASTRGRDAGRAAGSEGQRKCVDRRADRASDARWLGGRMWHVAR